MKLQQIVRPLLSLNVLAFLEKSAVRAESESVSAFEYDQLQHHVNVINNVPVLPVVATIAIADEVIISNDLNLIVAIDPLIRVDLFQTSQNLSPDGVQAFLLAMSNFTTVRMQTYFTNTYGTNDYIFDSVVFEALEVSAVVPVVPVGIGIGIGGTRRNLRVFEREEEHVMDRYGQDPLELEGEELKDYQRFQRSRESRDLQGQDGNGNGNAGPATDANFGTSFLLGGNFIFESIPAAPSNECNRKLAKFMTKYWSMAAEINALQHPELIPRSVLPITTTLIEPSPQPSLSPSKVPTALPSTSPIKMPTSKPSKAPTSTPTTSMVPTYTAPPQVPVTNTYDEILEPNVNAGDGNDTDLLPIVLPVLFGAAFVAIAALFFIQRRKQNNGFGTGSRNGTGSGSRNNMTLLHHDKLREEDGSDFESGSDPHRLLHVASTKDTNDSDSQRMVEHGNGSRRSTSSGSGSGSGSGSKEEDPVESLRSPNNIEYRSISTSETMKTGNLIQAEQEESWRNSSQNRSTRTSTSTPNQNRLPKSLFGFTSTPNQLPKKPTTPQLSSGNNVTFPVKQLSDDSRSSASTPLFGEDNDHDHDNSNSLDSSLGLSDADATSSPQRLEIVSPVFSAAAANANANANTSRALFDGGAGGGGNNNNNTPSPKSRSMTTRRSASPLISVSPSKVSKEEFEKDWDVDLPFNWNPTPATGKSDKKKKKRKNKTPVKDKSKSPSPSTDNELEGSFPTFDMVDDPPNPPIPPPPVRSHTRSNSNGSSTQGDSTYHTVNEIHPLDWSKGSEYDHDGASRGESTLSENDTPGHGWGGRLSGVAGAGRSPILLNGPNDLTGSTNYLTPNSNLTDAKSPYTDVSRGSGYASSSPGASSRGSSKQLINDIVWLEKKIADVRKRVDKLDGDGSQTTGSPPMSPPRTSINRSAGSPITSDIICQDVIAPPGKLQIVIHSTKDGPAIHSIKPGSVLEGKLSAGDLILSVNDTDCRNLGAEEVMEMMARQSTSERKLTVLHAAFV